MGAKVDLAPRRGSRKASPPRIRVLRLVVLALFAFGGYYALADGRNGRKLLEKAAAAGALTAEGASSLLASYGIAASTRAGDLEVREHCRAEDSAALAERFFNLTKTVGFFTACPDASWMDALARISPGGKTIIDIGCNKGYSSARFFGLWAPELGFRPDQVRERRPEILCGTCNDCTEKIASPRPEGAAQADPVHVYCVEPSLRNFANLVGTRDAFFSSQTPAHLQWFLINAAVSNATGTVPFPRGCVDELCSLEGNSDGTRPRDVDPIPLYTVDAMLSSMGIPHVDVLKIDTEGYDAEVLNGALEALGRGAIDVLAFEYHEVGVWKQHSINTVAQKLAGFDFVCYFDGKPQLTRITGCWHDSLEFYQWSNVVCVRRSHALYPEMEKLSTRYELFKDAYYAPIAPGNASEPAQ